MTARERQRRTLYRAVGARLAAERSRQNMTQQEVGAILGVSRVFVSVMEGGHSAILLEHLYNLAFAWDVPITRLLPKG